MSGNEVTERIRAWFEASFGLRSVPDVQAADDVNYTLADPNQLLAILIGSPAEANPRLARDLYDADHYDCEDYAIETRAALAYHQRLHRRPPFALGLLFSDLHATNVGIDSQGDPFLLDWYFARVFRRAQGSLASAFSEALGPQWALSTRYVLI